MLWCSKFFNASRRIIQVGDNTIHPISLNPLVLQRMLRLLEPSKEFTIVEVDDFIKNHGGPKRLLPYFINSFYGLKTNSF